MAINRMTPIKRITPASVTRAQFSQGVRSRRRVDFITNVQDRFCHDLASVGMTSDYISHMTGLSPSQVQYRCWLGRVKRADYRNGRSPLANYIVKRVMASSTVEQLMEKSISSALRNPPAPHKAQKTAA